MAISPEHNLNKLYPKLFNCCEFVMECGPGWYQLILDLTDKIHKIVERDNLDIYVEQIKEKYGELRYYLSTWTDEIDKLVREAEDLSIITCEVCGKTGKMNDGPWFQVRCESCP